MPKQLGNRVATLEDARNEFAHFAFNTDRLGQIGQECILFAMAKRWRQDYDQMVAAFAKQRAFGVVFKRVAGQHVFGAANLRWRE